MINHHLSDEMIMAFGAGTLSAGQAFLVACHLDICPHCAARVAEAEMIGGAMIETCDEASLSDDLFDRILMDIDDDSMPLSATPASASGWAERALGQVSTPRLLEALVGSDYDAIKWRSVGPGIKQYLLPVEDSEGEKVRLLRLSPGFVTPEHSHHGSELTLVLKGSFSDDTGRYCVGDIQDADEETHHHPMADTEEECICLVCTDAPLEFKGMIPKLLQPILGI
ncbi:ChrR family anti-sigma-E factor [uncultured Cohaesibacter sp.]|uniref:ChrR family anti-sigma-E factor n=1 Tax=uncultured Cohaesibacter sp. TaxID=1002546 RepID=UPI00292CADAE|nr:ChrR family anti-sigma-E factor [uncultured Cohaesibacter sp.]